MKNKFPIQCVLIAFILFSVKTANAQSAGFKLSDYKNPDYLYQILDLNLQFNSGFLAYPFKNTPNSSARNFSLNSGAGANYSRYKNTLQTQQEQHISFDAGIGSSSYKHKQDNNGPDKSSSFSNDEGLSLVGINRFYNEKQQYFEVNGTLSGRYNGLYTQIETLNADTITTKGKSGRKDLALNFAGGLLIGKGRIEQVQDARLAMFILEDLQKLNRTKKPASDEQVLALAREITLLKYKRFFDNRLRKIAEITAIDAFLQKNNIAGIADAAYFTSLNDNWDFANNPFRNSGKRWFSGLEANYGYQNKNTISQYIVPAANQDEYTYRQNNGGLFIVAGMDCEKPVNLAWQESSSLKIGVGIQSQLESEKALGSTTETTYYLRSLPSAKLTADYGFGYYPNSRTWITFKWWLLTGWDKEMDGKTSNEKVNLQNSFYTYTGPQLNAYFYLSEKLRLSLAFNGEFRFDKDMYTYEVVEGNPEKATSTWWNQQVTAGLTYSLF